MVLELISNFFDVCNCALQLGEFCVMLMEEMRTQKRRVGIGIVVIAFITWIAFHNGIISNKDWIRQGEYECERA